MRPAPGRWPVETGTAELLRDADATDGWLLTVDGVPQSYVDLADPTHLEFDYVRLLGDVVDCVAPAAASLAVVHLGGGACTLARYVAATRPGSRQVVVEADPALAALVREQLGTRGFRLRVGDARQECARLSAGVGDLVVADVFESSRQPVHTTTLEWLQEIRRLLRPGGVYAVNVADGPPLPFARAQVATLCSAFSHVALLADPSVLRGRRFANLVLVGSDAPLPLEALTRRAARAAARARIVSGDDLVRFTGAAPPDLFRR
ncbi:MAG TPA: fused MFS/spermidine synthase [Mycobacteriales bacterium]|nr:fused MFS/spermidine synthase [Mycobacteriales bacterium]